MDTINPTVTGEGNAPREFPSLAEQIAHWNRKEAAELPSILQSAEKERRQHLNALRPFSRDEILDARINALLDAIYEREEGE